jgi:hypothetical protein
MVVMALSAHAVKVSKLDITFVVSAIRSFAAVLGTGHADTDPCKKIERDPSQSDGEKAAHVFMCPDYCRKRRPSRRLY